MSADEGVTRWLRQLEAGDQDAARLLWQRYYRELVELARARLGQTPRRMADEEDIALSVLRSLCEGAAQGSSPPWSIVRSSGNCWPPSPSAK